MSRPVSIVLIILSLFESAPRDSKAQGILVIAVSAPTPETNAGICEITDGAPSYSSQRFLIAP